MEFQVIIHYIRYSLCVGSRPRTAAINIVCYTSQLVGDTISNVRSESYENEWSQHLEIIVSIWLDQPLPSSCSRICSHYNTPIEFSSHNSSLKLQSKEKCEMCNRSDFIGKCQEYMKILTPVECSAVSQSGLLDTVSKPIEVIVTKMKFFRGNE